MLSETFAQPHTTKFTPDTKQPTTNEISTSGNSLDKNAPPTDQEFAHELSDEQIFQDYVLLTATAFELEKIQTQITQFIAYRKFASGSTSGSFPSENDYVQTLSLVHQKYTELLGKSVALQYLPEFKRRRNEMIKEVMSARDTSAKNLLKATMDDITAEIKLLKPSQPLPESGSRFSMLDVEDHIIPQDELNEVAIARAIGLANIPEKEARQHRWNLLVQRLIFHYNFKGVAANYLQHPSTVTALELINTINKHSEETAPTIAQKRGNGSTLREALADRFPDEYPTQDSEISSTQRRVPPPYEGPSIATQQIINRLRAIDTDVIARVRSDIRESERQSYFKNNPRINPGIITEKVNFYLPKIIDGDTVSEFLPWSGFRDILYLYTELLKQNVDLVDDLDKEKGIETFGYDKWDQKSLHDLLSKLLDKCGGKEQVIQKMRSYVSNSSVRDSAVDYFCEQLMLV